jgi:orotidine-5'-phosphate decarboxylase
MKKTEYLKKKSDVFIALDFPDKISALDFLQSLSPNACHLKIGLEMFTKLGPAWVKTLIDQGYEVFLDLKCFDIPNTVAQTIKSIASLGVAMTTVHAMGGLRMMQAAKDALNNLPIEQRPLLLAVTVLTSYTDAEIKAVFGDSIDLETLTLHLATLAKQAGMDGIVCSPHEVKAIRDLCGEDFCIVTPGIRLDDSEQSGDDQRRTATPNQARQDGASFLVIGRPITQSSNPSQILQQIKQKGSV